MRTQSTTKETLQHVMAAIGQAATTLGAVYFVGGSTAVWLGLRDATRDVDLTMAPEPAGVFGAITRIKRDLKVNIELASPSDFVPSLPGWQGRSEYIDRYGLVDFYHFDFYGQVLAKIERGHERDWHDVDALARIGKIEPSRLVELLCRVDQQASKYPRLDWDKTKAKVASWAARVGG